MEAWVFQCKISLFGVRSPAPQQSELNTNAFDGICGIFSHKCGRDGNGQIEYLTMLSG